MRERIYRRAGSGVGGGVVVVAAAAVGTGYVRVLCRSCSLFHGDWRGCCCCCLRGYSPCCSSVVGDGDDDGGVENADDLPR